MAPTVSPVALAAAIAKLDLSAVPVESREAVMTLSLARLLAYQLPLPSDGSAIEPYGYFNQNFLPQVEATAGQVNEACVVNISDVAELARRVWVFRYRVAYDPSHASVAQLIDALIKCGSPEITKTTAEDFTKYSPHVEQMDLIMRPLVLSLAGR